MFPNGLNPSVAKPSLRFLASSAKVGNNSSKSFQASPSAGWLISFSTGTRLSLCHRVSSDVALFANILFSLGIRGKYLKTFLGSRLAVSASTHLDSLHFGQLS